MDDDALDAPQNGRPRRHDGRDPWSLVTRAEAARDPAARAEVTADLSRERPSEAGLPAPGDAVAVLLRRDRNDAQGRFEEVWLEVTAVDGEAIAAVFDSQPTWVRGVSSGDPLTLGPEHILTIRQARRRPPR